MTKIVFWDYDGTLVDTETAYKHSLIYFLNEKKLALKPLDDNFFYKFISGNHPEGFLNEMEKQGYIANANDISSDDIRIYYDKYFASLKKGDVKVIDNVDNIIGEIAKQKDIFMCITTSSYPKGFEIKNSKVNSPILDSIFKLDKNIYLCGAISDCKFKPSPDIYFYAFQDIVKKNNLQPTENDTLFIVEDSKTGCIASNNFKNTINSKINVKIIGYTAGMQYEPYKQEYINKLIDAGADLIANNSKDLLKFIINQ